MLDRNCEEREGTDEETGDRFGSYFRGPGPMRGGEPRRDLSGGKGIVWSEGGPGTAEPKRYVRGVN